MKKSIFYFGFLATFLLGMLSCQKDSSKGASILLETGITQNNLILQPESTTNTGTVLFEGQIVARRTDTVMLPEYKEMFTKNLSLEAIVYDSRNGYLGLNVVPPIHSTTVTGYSCPQGSQNCNDVAILDMGGVRRGIMSWITAMLGFN
jgi:hypothetical protein